MFSPYSAMNCSIVIFFFESKYFQIAAVISAMMEPANEVIERSALCGNCYSNERGENQQPKILYYVYERDENTANTT